jgi:hypothetical protein
VDTEEQERWCQLTAPTFLLERWAFDFFERPPFHRVLRVLRGSAVRDGCAALDLSSARFSTVSSMVQSWELGRLRQAFAHELSELLRRCRAAA